MSYFGNNNIIQDENYIENKEIMINIKSSVSQFWKKKKPNCSRSLCTWSIFWASGWFWITSLGYPVSFEASWNAFSRIWSNEDAGIYPTLPSSLLSKTLLLFVAVPRLRLLVMALPPTDLNFRILRPSSKENNNYLDIMYWIKFVATVTILQKSSSP